MLHVMLLCYYSVQPMDVDFVNICTESLVLPFVHNSVERSWLLIQTGYMI